MAAVLASGDGAVLSHRSATALFGAWGSGTGEIHVTVPRKVRSTRIIRRHFSMLPDDEREVVDGIPVTSAARAVLDLASEKGEAAAESALRELEYLGIYGKVSLPTLLARHPNHRGAQACREALEQLEDDPGGRLRSDLEERFITFLDAKRIPRPRLNAWLSIGDDRFQVDCLWPEQRLIAELDGWRSHGTKRAFRTDRKRDRKLGTAGYRVIRITEDQLRNEPGALARDLQASVIAYAPWQPQ
jgi:very-short-patch-repair endonuclease